MSRYRRAANGPALAYWVGPFVVTSRAASPRPETDDGQRG